MPSRSLELAPQMVHNTMITRRLFLPSFVAPTEMTRSWCCGAAGTMAVLLDNLEVGCTFSSSLSDCHALACEVDLLTCPADTGGASSPASSPSPTRSSPSAWEHVVCNYHAIEEWCCEYNFEQTLPTIVQHMQKQGRVRTQKSDLQSKKRLSW